MDGRAVPIPTAAFLATLQERDGGGEEAEAVPAQTTAAAPAATPPRRCHRLRLCAPLLGPCPSLQYLPSLATVPPRRRRKIILVLGTAVASLQQRGGELGDAMVSMLPRDLPFTVFVPSADSFSRVLRLQGSSSKSNASAAAAGGEAAASDTDSNTYAILSCVLGFSAVPRRLLAADVPPPPPRADEGAVRLLDSVSGLRLYASRDAHRALVVNGVRSECVDLVRDETVVHVMAGVLMDAEFERSFSAEFDG